MLNGYIYGHADSYLRGQADLRSWLAGSEASRWTGRFFIFFVCLWVRRPLEELTGNFMLSRKGQCKWTCRLTPFPIFILLHHIVISVNNSSFIWPKTSFPCIAQLSYFSVLGCNIYTHERREHYATGGGRDGGCCHTRWHALPCLLCWSIIY